MQRSSQIQLGAQARASIQRGFDQLADLLEVTLGPLGRTVAITRDANPRTKAPDIVIDGSELAQRVYAVPDRFASMGLRLARQLAAQMQERVGDGGSTAVVLSRAMIRASNRCVAAGFDPMQLRHGLEKVSVAVIQAIEQSAGALKSEKHILALAQTLTGNETLAKLLAECFDVVGPQGHIEVRPSQSIGHDREYIQGVLWNEGWASSHFVTQGGVARLERPYILCTTHRLTSAAQLMPIMSALSAQPEARGLVVIAFAIQGDALNLLVTNKVRGAMPTLAINAPGVGAERIEILRDLATLTGARLFAEEAGDRLENATLADLGSANEVQAIRSSFTIVGGKGKPPAIRARINTLRQAQKQATDLDEKRLLAERVGKLLGGVALLRVGGASESERQFLKKRCEEAVRVIRLGMEHGIVAGGGVAYLAAIAAIDAVPLSADEAPAKQIFKDALQTPFQAIVRNSGEEANPLTQQAMARGAGVGFDVRRMRLVNMLEANIVDPLAVVTAAVQTATSAAAMAMTTEAAVHKPRSNRDDEVSFRP